MEAIQIGAIQRIANAVEKVAAAAEATAKSHQEIQADRDYYKARAEYWKKQYNDLQRSFVIQKGLTTRYKNKLQKTEQ